MNVVGGYVVTDRMLQMFRKKPAAPKPAADERGGRVVTTLEAIEILVRIAWLVGAVGFVLGLARMNSPATARNGNLVSAARHGARDRRDGGADPGPSAPRPGELRHPIVDLGADHRRRDHRRRPRPLRGADREDDGDAAAGVAVQRGRRRRGGPHRHRRLPAVCSARAACASTPISSSCSTSSSARSRSPGR